MTHIQNGNPPAAHFGMTPSCLLDGQRPQINAAPLFFLLGAQMIRFLEGLVRPTVPLQKYPYGLDGTFE